MSGLGLCVNFRNAMPSRDEIIALGVTGIRSIAYNDDDVETALQQVPHGVRVVVIINNEHEGVGPDYSGWSEVIAGFASRFSGRVHAIEAMNEADLLGFTPEFAAQRAREARQAAGQDSPIKILLSSVASENWVDWLQKAAALCIGWADGVCLHPYGKSANGQPHEGWGFGDMADAIRTAHSVSGLPVWLTETGIKIGDAGGEAQQAAYLTAVADVVTSLGPQIVPFAAYFAWADAVGGPSERGINGFGLRDEQFRARPAWQAMANLTTVHKEPAVSTSVWGGDPPPGARFVLGFANWATREPTLIGQAHDVEEFGVFPGISQQRTTRGLLTWADLTFGQVTSFLDATNGKRYIWDSVSMTSTEVKPGAAPVGPPPLPVQPPAPTPAPVPVPAPAPVLSAPDASLMDFWQAVVPSGINYAPGTALSDLWSTDPYRFGPPLGPERYTKDADGNVTEAYQTFTNARLVWRPGDAGASVV